MVDCVCYQRRFDISRNMSYLAENPTKGVKDAAIANSTECYLLVDRSKQGMLGFCKFAELSDFEAVFTDTVNVPEEAPGNFRLL